MLLIDFMVISFIIGFLRRGNLKGLTEIPMRRLELIFLSFIIRYAPLFLKGPFKEFASNYIMAISIISYTLLLSGLFSNWHIKPLRAAAIGVLMNFLVIVANGGKMPVSLWAVDAAGLQEFKSDLFNPDYLYHTALTSSTRLALLGDIIPLPRPYPRPRVFSIGDLLMAAGIFFLVQDAMLKKKPSSGKIIGR
ncbi:DUF5317 domain-containing protein [Thermosediminibacter litoriperuensis]|uniref:DUF5317 domain-containing protein n=1 Tax=Thermosediminibacter litoriperuensis TaxID=291989 RepID=A0A5S5AZM7_9FIRM|nr:DUF5317 domain-containing protein [Thermosediminibacter litoriperuensis]TYP57824.1 hypothetical protein LZ11_00482 [Thermosediminibacter litoriperuensis]